MVGRRWKWTGLLLLAGVALWMLLAGRTTRLGLDIGMLGSVLLIGTAWLALYTVSTMHCMSVSLGLDGDGLGTTRANRPGRRRRCHRRRAGRGVPAAGGPAVPPEREAPAPPAAPAKRRSRPTGASSRSA